MDNSNLYLGTEKIGKLMKQYTIPCIISLLVGALYNIVDQIFIANASYLGSYGNAANTVAFSLTVVALALAVMIGDGCCAYVSICLGQGEKERARHSVGNAIVLSIAVSLVLTALYLGSQNGLISLFGGTVNHETFDYSREYFFYICPGIPFYMFGQAMGKAAASTALSMIREVVFGVGFALLLPVFFGLDGILLSMPVSDLLSFIIAVFLIISSYRELGRDRTSLPLSRPVSLT